MGHNGVVFGVVRRARESLCYREFELPAARWKRIYHAHIRKCGGTSVNQSFIKGLGGTNRTYSDLARHPSHRLMVRGKPVVGWNQRLLQRGAFFYGFSHLSLSALEIKTEDTFVISFLRDPIERIVSHFRMLEDYHRQGWPGLKEEKKFFGAGSFFRFIDALPREHLQSMLHCFSYTFDVGEALRNVSQIAFLGHLGRSEVALKNRISTEFGFNLDYHLIRKSKSSFVPNKAQIGYARDALAEEIIFYERAKRFCIVD